MPSLALQFGLLFLLLSLSACLRLDGNLFNPNTKPITEYRFDDYPNEREQWGSAYDIAADKIHLFNITSDLNGDQAKLYAVYVGDIARIAIDTVILYCHGNRDHMDHYWQRTKLLANVGGKHRYGVMTLDYRGYGLSEGTPSEDGLYADVDAAMKWLQSQGLTADRLVIYGFSLGSAPSTRLSAQPRTLRPSKLILEAPFASAEVMVQDAARLALPGSYFVNLKIDNAEQIKAVNQPFMWLHGEDDDFLSIRTHGSVVAKNYSGPYKVEWRVPGANHGDLPSITGPEEYINRVGAFMAY